MEATTKKEETPKTE